jgi:hypothetical protein
MLHFLPQERLPAVIEGPLEKSIEESLGQYGKAHPFAVINHAQLQKPPVVKELEDDHRVQLVHPQYGYDCDERGNFDAGKRNQTLLQWMVAKATYAPNINLAKAEVRSLLQKKNFIPHMPPTLFDRLRQQLKSRMHDLGKGLKDLPADAGGIDLTFRLPQFMHPCTATVGERASQLDVLPKELSAGLGHALLQPGWFAALKPSHRRCG